MRIVGPCKPEITTRLRSFKGGDVVIFSQKIHEKHAKGDPFLLNQVCSSYMPHRAQHNASDFQRDMQAVTNLRTGHLAWFLKTKRCRLIEDAELCLSQ